MQFASLGSGSKGNGTLVAWQDQLLLVDCGFTIKETERRITALDRRVEEISAILVTHEHGDHIKGVPALARKYNLPVYMTPGTFKSRKLGKLPKLYFIEGYQSFSLGGIEVQPVAVPHDAREPAQFIFTANGRRLGVLTDIGSISAHVEAHFGECDALLLEANHDSHMLATGSYPHSLKQRVGGPWGHLNNHQAAAFLQRANRQRLETLVVGHISQQNNCPEKARAVLADTLVGLKQVVFACQDEGFGWLNI